MHMQESYIRLAIFASGSGSNCENIIRYFETSHRIGVSLVLSNRADAYALVRAERLGVPTVVVSKEQLADEKVLLPLLRSHGIDFIVLAGFLPLVPNYLAETYEKRMLNIHPSLLPKYGGKGMWGRHVHEAVKKAGERQTGMTVHYVTPVCDEGGIVAQFSVDLSPDDSVEDIMEKEHRLEMEHFPKVIEMAVEEAFFRKKH